MRRLLLLTIMFIGTYSFSQNIIFNVGYMQVGEWNSAIEDYDILEEKKIDVSIEAYEDYFIFVSPDKQREKVYHEFQEENSDDEIATFYLKDFDGEEALIIFNEEQELIYLFGKYNDEIENWENIMIMSDIKLIE